ncbi:MAG: hypothetical protein ACKVH8_03415 [Pirellulales bacterium]|jgi:hypothetical protein
MEFLNQTVEMTFTSPDTKNAHAKLSGLGWKEIKRNSTDGVTNVLLLLTVAKTHGRSVSGKIENDHITEIYLN